jgi:hypothetical protein
LANARDGDKSWTTLKKTDGYSSRYEDAILHKGRVFAVDGSGRIYTWDIKSSVCHELPSLPQIGKGDIEIDGRSCKLAKTANGRLLLVCTYCRYVERAKLLRLYNYYEESTYLKFVPEAVLVYERDVDAAASLSNSRWSPVASLGDNSLFLG